MAYTRGQIVALVRQACDIENSTAQVDSEIANHINDAARYVHDFLIGTYGDTYAIASDTFVTVAGTAAYTPALSPEPAYVTAVHVRIDDTDYPLGSFSVIDEVMRTSGYPWSASLLPRYAFGLDPSGAGSTFLFNPPPDSAKTVTVYFHKAPPQYTSDADDVLIPHVDLLIIEAAIRVKRKEERDSSELKDERARIQKRIEDWVGSVDRGNTPHTLRMGRYSRRLRSPSDREF